LFLVCYVRFTSRLCSHQLYVTRTRAAVHLLITLGTYRSWFSVVLCQILLIVPATFPFLLNYSVVLSSLFQGQLHPVHQHHSDLGSEAAVS